MNFEPVNAYINGIISLPSSPYPTTIFCDSFSLDTQAPFSYTRFYQKRTSHKFPEDKVIIGEKYRDYVGKIRPKDIVLRFQEAGEEKDHEES